MGKLIPSSGEISKKRKRNGPKNNVTRLKDCIIFTTHLTKRNNNTMIKNEQGKLILEPDELKRVWKEYAETLFNDQRTDLNPTFQNENMNGPKILESEVRHAVDNLKNNKSPGHDDVHAEVLKQVDFK
ncbi:hypothetical protein HHI36_005615 [Cryptolaemus montrouzieri]|uniref:Uncharacterized protein n=1 Tax=Cryptolaemus montrouzieri TaxID=559131 RepID=A0ABD2NV55_9CUCU